MAGYGVHPSSLGRGVGGRGKGKGGGASAPARATPYTEKEQIAKLEGYIKVPTEFWPAVKYSAHVRYIRKDGKFVPGGFVVKNPFDTQVAGEGAEKRFLRLQNGFNAAARSYATWMAAYEDIEHLYVKGDGAVLAVRNDLEAVAAAYNSTIQQLQAKLKSLERRIADLEDCGRSSRRS